MEFEEVFTSPASTQTTCYSFGRGHDYGGRNSVVAVDSTTENHILDVNIRNDGAVTTSCRSLPSDRADQFTCVGYANWEEEEETHKDRNTPMETAAPSDDISSFTTIRHHIEALALVDPDLVEDSEHLPLPPSIIPPGSHHRKTKSEISKNSHNSTTTATIDDTQQSYHKKSKSDDKEALAQKFKARLLLKQDRYDICQLSPSTVSSEGDDDRDCNHDERNHHQTSSFALLNFRPLCPCIGRWGKYRSDIPQIQSNDDIEDNKITGIWVGSADDASLRFYIPSPDNPRLLISAVLPDEHFSVDSPILALDFCSVKWPDSSSNKVPPIPTHTLAIACQDGTVQLITWKEPNTGTGDNTSTKNSNKYQLFGELTSQKVIVDGPLICLKLVQNQIAPLRVIIGSLCGYVCQLSCDDTIRENSTDLFWEGPHMIVQDLYNSNIQTEESVLAIDAWDNYVVAGTHLGRCLLYSTHDDQNYYLVWQVVLPYPIHGIRIIKMNRRNLGHAPTSNIHEETRSCMLSLAITTRRSFHVFRAISGGIAWRQKPKTKRHSSELAMVRLDKILQKLRQEKRTCILKVIDDLLIKVEENAKKNEANVMKDSSTEQLKIVDGVSCAPVSDPIDQLGNHSVTDLQSSINTYDSEIRENITREFPSDQPHWEYSSSDEENSLILEEAGEEEK